MIEEPSGQLRPLFEGVTSRGLSIKDDPLSDFRRFLYMVWKHLGLPPPTPIQYDIANYLQKCAFSASSEDDMQRIIIEAYRGVGKSWITSAFVVWLLYMNPQLNIMVVSASKDRADDFTTFTLRLIYDIAILNHLIPERDQRQSKIAFDVGPARASHAPSVKSRGITGQLTGGRADIIIADDIEVPNNSATQLMRDNLSERVKEFDAILKPGGRVIFLGTPQTEMTIYNVLLTRGYKLRVWPARYPDDDKLSNYGLHLAPYIMDKIERGAKKNTSTDPDRFSDIDLMQRELSYGRSGFALQFMLDTRLSDAEKFPLKLNDLIVMDIPVDQAPATIAWAGSRDYMIGDLPAVGLTGDIYHKPMMLSTEWLPFTGSVMSIDPSGRGADETGYAVVKMLNSNLYVPEAGGLSGGYSAETLKELVEIAKRQKVNMVVVEDNFGDGMFVELIKPYFRQAGYPVTIEGIRSSKSKEQRIIDVLEPVVNQHRLVVSRKVIQQDFDSTRDLPPEKALAYQLFYQFTRITREKGALVHDDRLDALAMAVAYWVEQMALDQEEQLGKHREDLLQAEIDKTKKAMEMGLAVTIGALSGSLERHENLAGVNTRFR